MLVIKFENCDWTSGWKSKNSRLNQSSQRERTGSFHAVENLSISSKLILSTPERGKLNNLSFIFLHLCNEGLYYKLGRMGKVWDIMGQITKQ